MPPFFQKKSTSEAGCMADSHRKVLHRCRMILLKDLDVPEIAEALVQEEIFKPEVREHLLSLPNREHRVAILLDKLETKGDRAFTLLMDILREHYKHLHYVMEESLRTIDELHDSEHREHIEISGEAIRKLLKTNLKRKVDHSHGSESAEDLDLYLDDRDDRNYIDCYTIPMRGKLQKESWIKQASQPRSASTSGKSEEEDGTYMAVMCQDAVFKKVDLIGIPSEVRRPPTQCGAIYVIDDEKQDTAPNSEDDNGDVGLEPEGQRDTLGAPLEQAPPPPLPPKPGDLPENSPLLRKPPSLKARDKKEKREKKTEADGNKPAKMSKSKSKDAADKPRKTKTGTTKVKSKVEKSEELLSESPPLPPRLPGKLPAAPGKPPPVVPSLRRLSSSATAPSCPPPEETDFPVTSSEPQDKKDEGTAETPTVENLDEGAQTDGQTLTRNTQPPASLQEEDDPPEDEYECVSDVGKGLIAMARNTSDHKLDAEIEIDVDTKSDAGLDDASPVSEESTQVEPDQRRCEQLAQDESSKTSADSVETADARSMTTDSGVEATTPRPQLPLVPGKREPKALPLLPDVQVLAGDISSDSDSYYEDIDVMDGGSKNSTSASSPSRTSLMYLDPRQYVKSFDKLASVQEMYNRTSLKRKPEPDWESMGKFKLFEGDLVIAELETVVSQEVADKVGSAQLNSDSTASSDRTVVKSEEEAVAKTVAPTPATTSVIIGNRTFPPPTTKPPIIGSKPLLGLAASTKPPAVSTPSKTPCLTPRRSLTAETPVFAKEDTEPTASVSEEPDPLVKYVDTVLVFDKVGRVFFVPKHLLRKHGTPEGQPWFYPIEISSRQATLFLSSEKQEGVFLVYTPSSKSSGAVYNLSVSRANGNVVHYHIIENIHGDMMIEGHDHSFMNIQDLVDYFRKNKSQLATRLGRPLKEAKLQLTPGYHYDSKWEVNRSHLTLTGKIVGKGNFGVVCAGLYHNIPVAIKVLQKVDATIQEEDEFIEEAKTMMKLWHDNVVRLVGVSCVSRPYFLISEYVSKGNLHDCLQSDSIPKDNIDSLFDICIQTAGAMNYLESRHYILHRDLAARNFLVTEDHSIKLGDFGRARYVVDDHYQAPRNEKVSIKWAAPEVLIDSSYSTKSDVWALGIVFWEIFSGGQRPYEGLSGEQTAIYVTEGGRLDKPPGCAPDLFSMMKSCWREEPDDRPSFEVLFDKLKSKSSIYYSREPLKSGPRQQPARASEEIQLPRSTSSSSRQSRGSGGDRDSQKDPSQLSAKHKPGTPTTKHSATRRTVAVDGRLENSYSNQGLGNIREEPGARTGALTNSSSETSLISTADVLDKDDLTRGNKIRKSLRKIIHMKPRRKTNKLDGLQEWQGGGPAIGHEYSPS